MGKIAPISPKALATSVEVDCSRGLHQKVYPWCSDHSVDGRDLGPELVRAPVRVLVHQPSFSR